MEVGGGGASEGKEAVRWEGSVRQEVFKPFFSARQEERRKCKGGGAGEVARQVCGVFAHAAAMLFFLKRGRACVRGRQQKWEVRKCEGDRW